LPAVGSWRCRARHSASSRSWRCRTGRSSGSTSLGLRLFERLFDEDAFLSPFGIRALSRYHAEHPFAIQIDGNTSSIDYEPAESTTGMFGGNSNWREPIWMPVNYLVVNALARYGRFFGDDYTLE
jgi:hypothetical protein